MGILVPYPKQRHPPHSFLHHKDRNVSTLASGRRRMPCIFRCCDKYTTRRNMVYEICESAYGSGMSLFLDVRGEEGWKGATSFGKAEAD